MSQISEIVEVNITRETRSVSRQGFGVPLVLGPNAATQKTYASLGGVAEDFTISDAEYAAALRIFSQQPSPQRIQIGPTTAKVAQIVSLTITAAAVGDWVVAINGVDYTFTADGMDTIENIRDGLLAAISAPGVTDAGVSTDEITLTASVAGTPFTYDTTAPGMGVIVDVVTQASNGIQNDIATALAASNDWYALVLTSKNAVDQELAAQTIEANRRILAISTDDADIKNGVASNLFERLNAAEFDRTIPLWHEEIALHPEAGILGRCLPFDPGSITWKFKQITGVAFSALSVSESLNVRNVEGNTYERIGGQNIFREGTVASGEFIDIIRGVDWMTARIEEDIYEALVNAPKIPYTDAGIAVIENVLKARLDDAIAQGILASYTISVPAVADIPSGDRAARVLPDINFSGVLAGAIHKVEVRGTVSI